MLEVVELKVTGIQIKRFVLERSVLQLKREQGLDDQDSEQNGSADPSTAATWRGCPAVLRHGRPRARPLS